jgi:hypothetical protein
VWLVSDFQADKGGVRITCGTDAEAVVGAPGKPVQLQFSGTVHARDAVSYS